MSGYSNIVAVLLGAAISGCVWIAKMGLQMRRDLDQAFNKIRELEKRNDKLQRRG